MSELTLQSLPPEVLSYIVDFLPIGCEYPAARSCRALYEVLRHKRTLRRHIIWRTGTDQFYKTLHGLDFLRSEGRRLQMLSPYAAIRAGNLEVLDKLSDEGILVTSEWCRADVWSYETMKWAMCRGRKFPHPLDVPNFTKTCTVAQFEELKPRLDNIQLGSHVSRMFALGRFEMFEYLRSYDKTSNYLRLGECSYNESHVQYLLSRLGKSDHGLYMQMLCTLAAYLGLAKLVSTMDCQPYLTDVHLGAIIGYQYDVCRQLINRFGSYNEQLLIMMPRRGDAKLEEMIQGLYPNCRIHHINDSIFPNGVDRIFCPSGDMFILEKVPNCSELSSAALLRLFEDSSAKKVNLVCLLIDRHEVELIEQALKQPEYAPSLTSNIVIAYTLSRGFYDILEIMARYTNTEGRHNLINYAIRFGYYHFLDDRLLQSNADFEAAFRAAVLCDCHIIPDLNRRFAPDNGITKFGLVESAVDSHLLEVAVYLQSLVGGPETTSMGVITTCLRTLPESKGVFRRLVDMDSRRNCILTCLGSLCIDLKLTPEREVKVKTLSTDAFLDFCTAAKQYTLDEFWSSLEQ